MYRYLRAAGLLTFDGSLLPDSGVDQRIANRVRRGDQPFRVPATSRTRANRLLAGAQHSVARLAEAEAPADVYLGVMAMERQDVDLEALRRYLSEHAADFAISGLSTAWAKAVSLYDYYRYGPADSPEQDVGARSEA